MANQRRWPARPGGPSEVLVETGTSRDNVSRMARKEGWQVTVLKMAGGFKLFLKK